MKKLYISNAFSFNMISPALGLSFDLITERYDAHEVKSLIDIKTNPPKGIEPVLPIVSMSGEATRDLFNAKTGLNVNADHNNIVLNDGDSILVMQYNGPRLEAGLTEVPVGGSLKFFMVYVEKATAD